MIRHILKAVKGKGGFTLLEILIVVVILVSMALIVVPRISNVLSGKRSNFLILTTIIAKTFDDSFVNDRLNFVLLHLYEPGDSKDNQGIFSRSNGISVVTRNEDGNFTDSRNKLLQYKSFPDSFRIEEILLSTGEKITTGNALIPFYSTGQSDNVIVHILVNEEENWSVRIFKLRKEPQISEGFINFTDENEI